MQVYSSIREHTQRVYETENVSRMWPIQFNRRHIAVTVVVSDCLGFIAGCRCRCCVVFLVPLLKYFITDLSYHFYLSFSLFLTFYFQY